MVQEVKGSGTWRRPPLPSQAPTSRAPSGKGSGYQIVLPEAPMRHATTQPVTHAPQLPVTQHENIPQQHAQAPFAAPPSNSFGIFHSGVGSPGLLGGIITPPPVHAFPPLFNEPPLWQGLPPGLSDVPTSGLLPQGPSMNNVVHAFGVPESHALPAELQQAASLIRVATGEAGQDHTPLPGGSIQANRPQANVPQLHASQNGAGHTGEHAGNAQSAQEFPVLPPQDNAHMFEVSHEEFKSAGSAPAHMQHRMFREQKSMKVLPAAWQHQVPQVFEVPFSGGQAQRPRGAAVDDKVPVNIQGHVAP